MTIRYVHGGGRWLPFIYLKNVLSQTRSIIIPAERIPACAQDMSPDKILLFINKLLKPHMINVYKKILKATNRKPVFMMSHKYCLSSSSLLEGSSGESHPEKLGICFFNNLVNALPAQIVRICNLAKSHPLVAHIKNFRISRIVASRPWLEGTPRPSWKTVQYCLLFCRNHRLLLTLSNVSDPSPDRHLSSINDLHMDGRDSGVSGSFGELHECRCVQIESSIVVHG